MLCVVEGQLAYAPTVFFPMKNRCSHGGYRGMHACEIVQILQTIFQNYSLSCSVLIIMLEEKSRRFRRIHAMRWWCWCHTDDLNDAMRSIVIIIDLAAVYYACNATLKHFKRANNSHTHTQTDIAHSYKNKNPSTLRSKTERSNKKTKIQHKTREAYIE